MGMLEKMEWRRRGRWLCQYWEWQTKSHLFVWYFLLTNFNLWAHEESLNRVGTVWVNWIHRQWLWHKYFRGSFVFSELSHLCFLHCRSLLISCLQTKAVFPPKKVLIPCTVCLKCWELSWYEASCSVQLLIGVSRMNWLVCNQKWMWKNTFSALLAIKTAYTAVALLWSLVAPHVVNRQEPLQQLCGASWEPQLKKIWASHCLTLAESGYQSLGLGRTCTEMCDLSCTPVRLLYRPFFFLYGETLNHSWCDVFRGEPDFATAAHQPGLRHWRAATQSPPVKVHWNLSVGGSESRHCLQWVSTVSFGTQLVSLHFKLLHF